MLMRVEIKVSVPFFAAVELGVDFSGLSAGDRAALGKLLAAARVIDSLYLRQVWEGNRDLQSRLAGEELRLFWFHKGPWSALDDHRAFLPGVPARKPVGAAFYPEDMTRAEFDTLEGEEKFGFFSVIRRGDGGDLEVIPYSSFYRPELDKCGGLLREAAALTENESLRRFLVARADAFVSNDYYESDLAWMDLDAPLDVTIGPYETYADELFGYKAAFEAYICIRDEAETAKLKFFGDHMQELEDHLPMEARYRNPAVGKQSPMSVVNQVYAAGDGDHGVKTAAFNLPNDERVITQKGSKRVMLKNVQKAKFESVLVPISGKVLAAEFRGDVRFDAFFTHILAHEMGHGIGPQRLVGGSTPRQELKEHYSALEEAKADMLGLFILQHFADKGYWPVNERELYTTFLASSFRTLRFGLNEAHGKGMAIQFNYLMDAGAFVHGRNGWRVEVGKVRAAVRELAGMVLEIEATGDYAAAGELLDRLGVMRPEVAETLESIGDVPVDIDIRYVNV